MKKNTISPAELWEEEFEKIFILTYQEVYDHIRLLINDREMAKELLIKTYIKLYERGNVQKNENEIIIWLKSQSDQIALAGMKISQEIIEASYEEEKMQQKDSQDDKKRDLDEASVFLEIGDRLPLKDDAGQKNNRLRCIHMIQNLLSFCILLVSIAAVINCAGKIRHRLSAMEESILSPMTLELESDEEGHVNEYNEDYVEEDDSTKIRKVCIRVGDKAVYLSEIGQVLYSVPVEQTELADSPENPEIQTQEGWTYYLPCPDRENTQLGEVSPELYHTLYRMRGDGKEIEIVEEEIEDYLLWEDAIYVSKHGAIQRIEKNGFFKKREPGIYVVVENGEIYLHDEIGRVLKTEADGSIHYDDRIFKMSSNRIVNVISDVRQKGHTTYELKPIDGDQENIRAIYQKKNGSEEIFADDGKSIDGFCIVGDWMYYSVYTLWSESGRQYSQIFKKSLVRDEEAEPIGKEFPGRIWQMNYCSENNQIYASYMPKSWENLHSVIAAISLSGNMAVLQDEEQRSVRETTGNDVLDFVMAKDHKVYCFWRDNHWVQGENPVTIWRDAVVLIDSDRIDPFQ